MSETLAVALVTGGIGLIGAIIGAASAIALEFWREVRRGRALRRAIISDLQRCQLICSWASGGRLTSHPGDGLSWKEIAGELHVAPGLYRLVFMLYTERKQIEHAYDRTVTGMILQQEKEGVRFDFERWRLNAGCVIGIWDAHDERTIFRKVWHRFRKPLLERDDAPLQDVLNLVTIPVRDAMREQYRDRVNDEGDLVSAASLVERQRATFEGNADDGQTEDSTAE